MLTQAMPALAQALSGVLPDAAVRQLMQALGNCQQSLSHRGSVSLDPVQSTGKAGLRRPGAWNPAQYTRLLPTTGFDSPWRNVDIPRGTNGYPQMTNNYGGVGLDLPIDNAFATNNYYGGPTFNVGGNSNFDNSTHQNISISNGTVTNLRVQNINNLPIGDLGGSGSDGTGGGFFFNNAASRSDFTTGVLPPGRIAYQRVLTSTRGKYLPIKAPITVEATVPPGGLTVSNFKFVDNKYPIVMTQNFSVPVTSSAYVPTFKAYGTASTPTYSNFSLSGAAATISGGTVQVPTTGATDKLKMDFSGTVPVPQAGTLSNMTLAFTGSVPVPTTGTLANVVLAGNVPLKIPTEANVENLLISTCVTVPSKWSASFTAFNNVTIPVIQSAALDANCALQITWNNQVVSIPTAVAVTSNATSSSYVLGAPHATTAFPLVFPALDTNYTVNAQVSKYGDITLGTNVTRAVNGSVSISNAGTIALGSPLNTSVTGAVTINNTSTITLGGLAASSLSGASVSFTNNGKITYDTTNVSQNITVEAANTPVTLEGGNYTVNLSMSNTLTLGTVDTGTLTGGQTLDLSQGTEELQVDLESRFSNAVLIYYRPRF